MDSTRCQILLEEEVKLLLFCWRQWIDLAVGVLPFRYQPNGMIPFPGLWETVEGFLGEDTVKFLQVVQNWHVAGSFGVSFKHL